MNVHTVQNLDISWTLEFLIYSKKKKANKQTVGEKLLGISLMIYFLCVLSYFFFFFFLGFWRVY